MKSPSIPLCPAEDVNHPFVQKILLASHLVPSGLTNNSIAALVFRETLFYLMMAPKWKSTDAGHSGILFLCLIYKLNFTTGMYV